MGRRSMGSLSKAWLIAIGMAGVIAGCGGGGGSSASTSTNSASSSNSVLLTGTAYGSAAASGATIQLLDANNKTLTTTASASGEFSVDISSLRAPILLRSTFGSVTYFGMVDTGGTVANLNALTTQAVQAYYASLGTTAQAVASTGFTASTALDTTAIEALSTVVSGNILPYLVDASISQATVFDPFSASMDSPTTGLGRVLSRTTISGNSLTISVDNGVGSTAGSSSTSIGLASARSTINPDLVQVSVSQNGVSAVSQTLDLCRTQGTKIPGTGLFDCVSSFEAPEVVYIGYNGMVIFQEVPGGSSNLTPKLVAKDSAGNYTVTRKSELAFKSSNPSVITLGHVVLSDNSGINWPTMAAADVGTSTVTITDQLTNATIGVPFQSIVPVLRPAPLMLGGANQSGALFFTDGTLPVSILGGPHGGVDFPYDLSSDHPEFATVSAFYADWYGTEVQAVSNGQAYISFKGDFGSDGNQTRSVEVCVSDSGTSCSSTDSPTALSVTAPSASLAPGSSVQLSAHEVDAEGNAATLPALSWISSNADVSVNSSGLATASSTATGTVTLTAVDSANDLQGSVTLSLSGQALFPMSGVLRGTATLAYTTQDSVVIPGYTPPQSISLAFIATIDGSGVVSSTSIQVTGYTFDPFTGGILPIGGEAFCPVGTMTYLMSAYMNCSTPSNLGAVTNSVGFVFFASPQATQYGNCNITFALTSTGAAQAIAAPYVGSNWLGVAGAAQCGFEPFATGLSQDDYTTTSFTVTWTPD